MKRSVLSILILITGVFVLGFSGCTKEKEEEQADWAIPRFEKRAYVVKKGDSISEIAELHGVSPRQLIKENNLEADEVIHPGQRLIIPN